MFHALKPL